MKRLQYEKEEKHGIDWSRDCIWIFRFKTHRKVAGEIGKMKLKKREIERESYLNSIVRKMNILEINEIGCDSKKSAINVFLYVFGQILVICVMCPCS